MSVSYDNRRFRPVTNSETGEVSFETGFHHHQSADIAWPEYSGGHAERGSLIALVLDDGSLDMRYQHINVRGELMTGRCRSVPEVLPNGRLRLHEKWQWTSGDHSSGESTLEEILS